MTTNTIKITQLSSIGGNLSANTLLPVVDTAGTAVTDKVTVGAVANYILTEAGNLLPEAFVSTLAYNVVNSAQPNITSVGELNINTLNISGGENGQVLQTNGNGNLNWTTMTGGGGNGAPGGANSQLQFNLNGVFSGDTRLTWDTVSQTLTAENVNTGIATIVESHTGTANANVINANTVNATGNISAGHYIGNGSMLTGITAAASGSGPDQSVQFNNSGAFAGSSDLTFDATTKTLTTVVLHGQDANLTGTLRSVDISVTGNISGANLVSANHLTGDGSFISNVVAVSANIANVAVIANAVAVANVVGIGNIAVLSLDGNASNVLYGNGQFAPGLGAGSGTEAVGVGIHAGEISQGQQAVAVGKNAGHQTQGTVAVAVGTSAGEQYQGSDAVAVGRSAGAVNQGGSSVAVGPYAGQSGQGVNSVAVGPGAGMDSQSSTAVAIGLNAGNSHQSGSAVAIGEESGQANQAWGAISMGYYAGHQDQDTRSIAIGISAGQVSQGANAVAIGSYAAQTNQDPNSTVLNATGASVPSAGANTFVVKPVRQVSGAVPSGFYPAYYNPTTGEFIVVTP